MGGNRGAYVHMSIAMDHECSGHTDEDSVVDEDFVRWVHSHDGRRCVCVCCHRGVAAEKDLFACAKAMASSLLGINGKVTDRYDQLDDASWPEELCQYDALFLKSSDDDSARVAGGVGICSNRGDREKAAALALLLSAAAEGRGRTWTSGHFKWAEGFVPLVEVARQRYDKLWAPKTGPMSRESLPSQHCGGPRVVGLGLRSCRDDARAHAANQPDAEGRLALQKALADNEAFAANCEELADQRARSESELADQRARFESELAKQSAVLRASLQERSVARTVETTEARKLNIQLLALQSESLMRDDELRECTEELSSEVACAEAARAELRERERENRDEVDALREVCELSKEYKTELAVVRATTLEGDVQRGRLANELSGAELERQKLVREAHDEFNELENRNRELCVLSKEFKSELAVARATASEGDVRREHLAEELSGAESELRKLVRQAHDEFNELEKHNKAKRRSWEALEHRLEAREHKVKTEELG